MFEITKTNKQTNKQTKQSAYSEGLFKAYFKSEEFISEYLLSTSEKN